MLIPKSEVVYDYDEAEGNVVFDDGIRLELHWMDARVTPDESGYSIIFRLSLF